MKNYYKILEIEPTATQDHIKSQHRLLIHAWHPDKFPNAEQKVKAEERIKEINEAYSVLGDPVKRKSYDRILNTHTSPPHVQSYYNQTPQYHTFLDPTTYCHCCGLPAETKYIEFYENVGMVFMRNTRSIKGYFCKPCIDYYFWNLTSKTMLWGWWGIISFIVTPFILLNNLLRFIFTAGMKKPPIQITPKPSPFWIFTVTSGFFLIGYIVFYNINYASNQPTYSPPQTITLIPTLIPTTTSGIRPEIQALIDIMNQAKTQTAQVFNCIRWNQITRSMLGHKVCIYGTVYSIYTTKETSTIIIFTSQPYTFYLYDVNHIYPDLKEGYCIAAEEVLQLDDNKISYMSVSELYKCESWMK